MMGAMRRIPLHSIVVLVWLMSGTFTVAAADGAKSFTDPRDGRSYPVVRIRDQAWMGRDLNYEIAPSWCYQDDPAQCESNGRLYPWDSAIKACPEGWRLASDEDWMALEAHLGMQDDELAAEGIRGTDQGARLRKGGDSGFEAPISGYRRPDGSYARAGERSAYWLSTEADAEAAWHRDVRSDDDRIYRSAVPKDYALSVRCLKD